MRIDVLTLFPEMFQGVLESSILGRASRDTSERSAPVSYHLTNIRDYTTDKHQKVDHRPYGGGPGMVMQCQPIWDAVRAVSSQDPQLAARLLMTPQGRKLDQALAERLAGEPRLLIIAGHYEGIDERVVQRLDPIVEVSIGDYVLSGGELAAMVLIDTVVRLLPGVLGDEDSARCDSFSSEGGRLLDHPHYTRPRTWGGMDVPGVLLSGDHARVRAWRLDQAHRRTRERRPQVLEGLTEYPT